MADGKYLPLQLNVATSDEEDEEEEHNGLAQLNGTVPSFGKRTTSSLARITEHEHEDDSKHSDDKELQDEEEACTARSPSDYYTEHDDEEGEEEEMKQINQLKATRYPFTRENGSYDSVASKSSANVSNGATTTHTEVRLMAPQHSLSNDGQNDDAVNDTVTPLSPTPNESTTKTQKRAFQKLPTMVDFFPSLHQPIGMKRRGKLSKLDTVRVVQTNLSEDQSELLETQIDILLEEDVQQKILQELFEKYPKLTHSFSMVSGEKAQAAFVCRMVRKGYILIYNRSYDELYNILTRHSKYAIHKKHMMYCFDIIVKNVLQHPSITQSFDITLASKSRVVWNKSNEIIKDILQKAYKVEYVAKQVLSEKKLKHNRARIARSMSPEDIDCVTSIWRQMIEDNKQKVGEMLAAKIQSQEAIMQTFQKHHIDICMSTFSLFSFLNKIRICLNLFLFVYTVYYRTIQRIRRTF